MKALFCYDGPLYKDEKGDYYDSILNDQMFQRYFKVADKLELIIRIRKIQRIQAEKKMNRLENPKITVTECANLSSFGGLMLNVHTVKQLLKEKIGQADLIFIRLPSVIGNYSVDICRKLKKRYMVEVVGCPWDSYWNYSLRGKVVAPIATLMMKKRVKNAPFVLYVTNEFLQERYPTNGNNINCSNVELPESDEEIFKTRIKRINGYSAKTVYKIGTAAGLDVLYKGQQYIIQALGELKKHGITNFEYQLIGSGTGDYLSKTAKKYGVLDQVKIVGQLPHEKVFDWLDNIDIYAQPSRQEGLPRAVIEAMSRALPCIGAKTAGIPELIEDNYIFSNSKKEAYEIASILLSICNQDSLKAMAKRNFIESQKYQKNILAKCRTNFFKEFSGVNENAK